MRGQWIGSYTGTTEGNIIINIDEMNNNYEGVAYVIPTDKSFPSAAAHFSTENKSSKQHLIASINAIHPENLTQCSWDDIKHLYKGINFSKEARLSVEFQNEILQIDVITDIGVSVSTKLEKPLLGDSRIDGALMSWSEFKAHIEKLLSSNYLFRGQQKPWRLCTTYHRHGRYRLSPFTTFDLQQLHGRLSAMTSHYFDLKDPQQNGSFFNLIQHHGYPTPLLDWSLSPYVAAFFAFRDIPMNYTGNEKKVRIFIFDEEKWGLNFRQPQTLDYPLPYLSVMAFIAINNPRVVPQQSVTTVTNIDDIESYLIRREAETGTKYIRAIDILANEREKAMRDLKFMGITAGSMFSSIDGVCEEFREKNFDR